MKGTEADWTGAECTSPHSRKPSGEVVLGIQGRRRRGGQHLQKKEVHGVRGYSWRNLSLNRAFLTAHNIPCVTPNRARTCAATLSPMCRRLSGRNAARASRFASRYRSEPWSNCRRTWERSARRERVPSEIGGAEGFRSVTALTAAYRSTMGRNGLVLIADHWYRLFKILGCLLASKLWLRP